MAVSLWTIEQALKWAKTLLAEHGVSDDGVFDSCGIDSKTLLAACLDKQIVFLHTWPETQLSASQMDSFKSAVSKRAKGHPVAHIIGYRDFWSLRLKVSPATLIPRPETELVVEVALSLPLPKQAKVLDLGTGTGAIALALASERPNWLITGVDKSSDAVALAIENAVLHKQNVTFKQSDWFSAIADKHFNLIVSNPPYIENNNLYLNQGDVRFEPASALTSGDDGLDDIRHIVAQGKSKMSKNGWLVIEHGYQQHLQVSAIFKEHGFNNIRTEIDLNHLPRVTIASI